MPLPSYARATASSAQRTSHTSQGLKDVPKDIRDNSRFPSVPKITAPPQRQANSRSSNPKYTPTGPSTPRPPPPFQPKSSQTYTPKKLKRPSTLTSKTRRAQAYNADLHTIKPLNASKPCPLSTLPSELRTEIYTYLFSTRALHDPSALIKSINPSHRHQCARYLFPSILHVCRAIRIEAAYTFYTTVPFLWRIANLNFSRVKRWLEALPGGHRALLSRNRNLTLDVAPFVEQRYTYPPENYLLDDYVDAHWKACAPFGALYTLSGKNRQRFIVFCRLAGWWSLPCNSSRSEANGHKGTIDWVYRFDTHRRRDYDLYPTIADGLLPFLREEVGVVRMQAVQKAWTGSRREADMGREARRFLDALDGYFREVVGTEKKQKVSIEEWEEELRGLRDFVERW